MKKYVQISVVLALVLAVVGVARNRPAWASSLFSAQQPSGAAQPFAEIDVTESGTYYVGGLCEFNALYTGSGASAKVAIDVLPEDSRKVPFPYEGDLYLAGCHVIHYVLDTTTNENRITREISPAYGSWEVCFGNRPDVALKIYFYFDDPETGSQVWIALPTTISDGFSCAPAPYTGVYAPGAVRHPDDDGDGDEDEEVITDPGGTVITPPTTTIITRSGTYSAGGLCTLTVEYFVSGLSNVLHVEKNIDISANVPFPDNEGLLYLPGCHVFHYVESDLVQDVNETTPQGKWKICFAAIPGKQTTLYFYYARDERPESALPDWTPLETTVEGGMACAPLTDHTGVYAPTAK